MKPDRSRVTVIGGAAGERMLKAWTHPSGTPVLVTGDDGIERPMVTRSQAWMTSGHPAIFLEGISGGYALSRVRIATSVRRVHLAAQSKDRHDADPGCQTRMTKRDTLTADLDRVSCKVCLRRLEQASKRTSRVMLTIDAKGNMADQLDGVEFRHGERVRLTWPDGSTTVERIAIQYGDLPPLADDLSERMTRFTTVRIVVRGLKYVLRLADLAITVERLEKTKVPRVEQAKEKR